MNSMQISIINDCCDENAALRQVSRAGSLIKNSSVNCFGVKSETEAVGFLVDAIDSFEGKEGIILINVAPRGGKGKKWKNGAPFGYFWHKKTLIVSSADGYVLFLVKKVGILEDFRIFDIPEVLENIGVDVLDDATKERIVKSQFRSFDFLPRVAAWLIGGMKLPARKYDLAEIAELPPRVWFVDNFGNIKTTLLKEDLDLKNGGKVKLKIGDKEFKFDFYDRLKDIPDKTLGLTVGSSGIDDKRFIEIISRGGSAARLLEVGPDDEISGL